jgi:hypothetical protein
LKKENGKVVAILNVDTFQVDGKNGFMIASGNTHYRVRI